MRVPVNEMSLKHGLVSGRGCEVLCREKLKEKGVKFPSAKPRPPSDIKPLTGKITYHRIGSEVEAVWTPEARW